MEITKQHLIDLIEEINKKIDKLLTKITKQEIIISDLQLQNEQLKKSNHNTLEQIKEYIQELEEIRNHYVDSNNKN